MNLILNTNHLIIMEFCYVLLVHIFTGILSASRKPMVAFSSSELIFSTLSSGPTSLDLDSIPIPRTRILRKKIFFLLNVASILSLCWSFLYSKWDHIPSGLGTRNSHSIMANAMIIIPGMTKERPQSSSTKAPGV